MTICAHYNVGNPDEGSNLAVMEINLPSGYTVDRESLYALRKTKGVKRVDPELDDTKVKEWNCPSWGCGFLNSYFLAGCCLFRDGWKAGGLPDNHCLQDIPCGQSETCICSGLRLLRPDKASKSFLWANPSHFVWNLVSKRQVFRQNLRAKSRYFLALARTVRTTGVQIDWEVTMVTVASRMEQMLTGKSLKISTSSRFLFSSFILHLDWTEVLKDSHFLLGWSYPSFLSFFCLRCKVYQSND